MATPTSRIAAFVLEHPPVQTALDRIREDVGENFKLAFAASSEDPLGKELAPGTLMAATMDGNTVWVVFPNGTIDGPHRR